MNMPNLRRMVTGLGAWLQFEKQCGREYLFSERYLAAPLGQILSGLYGNRIWPEYEHPVLAPMASRGDKPRIDFVVFNEAQHPSVVIETKWAANGGPSIEQVAWDMIRLELAASFWRSTAYFILAGRRRYLQQLMANKKFHAGGDAPGSQPLLPRPGGNTKVILHPARRHQLRLFRGIFTDKQETAFAENFSASAARPYPAEVASSEFQVFGWAITPSRERTTFMPSAIKDYRVSGLEVARHRRTPPSAGGEGA